MSTYRIVRFYQDTLHDPPEVIWRGLTLEQAREHCQNPETHSDTATSPLAREISERHPGMWFDSYEDELTSRDSSYTYSGLRKRDAADRRSALWRRNMLTIGDPFSWYGCGCLTNSDNAHRVGCPDYPEGKRDDYEPDPDEWYDRMRDERDGI